MNSATPDLNLLKQLKPAQPNEDTALKTMLKSLFPLLTAMLLVNSSMMLAMQSVLPLPTLLPSLSLLVLAAAVLFISLTVLNTKKSNEHHQ